MEVAIVTFDGITSLDAIGPYEVLWRLPGARVRFVASEPGIKSDDNGAFGLRVEHSLDDAPRPDVVLVPGGLGRDEAMDDEALLDWLREVHAHSLWTASVCTGSLILGAAGLLRGLRATSHWRSLERLHRFGAEPTSGRVVEDGKVITAAGVSSGVDMALLLAERLVSRQVAEAIQLSIEYDPEPPFDAGSPEKAAPEVVERVRRSRGARASRPAEPK
jgi:transcriptional regulator GlxA family with amidase domain